MGQFEVEIAGDDLGRAMAALNEAGIPTIATGGTAPPPFGSDVRKRSFFRSWAFVILVVVVLAFLAQRLISPADEDGERTYDQFIAQIQRAPESIDRVTLDPDDSEVEVVERSGDEYSTGYPPSTEEALVNLLRARRVETVVEDTGGSSVLSWIAYLAPFALFFAFFLVLMRRMRRDDATPGLSSTDWRPTRLRAVVAADSADAAEAHVRQYLPGDAYRTTSRLS